MRSTLRSAPSRLLAIGSIGFGLVAGPSAQQPTLQAAPAKVLPAAAPAEVVFQNSAAWQRFLQQNGSQWAFDFCAATGTPRAVWGSGLPIPDWRGDSLDEARRSANRLLQEQAELLGLGTSDFHETIGARMGQSWAFVYDQFFRGLPVIGGRHGGARGGRTPKC